MRYMASSTWVPFFPKMEAYLWIRITILTAEMAKVSRIWDRKSTKFTRKYRLHKSFIVPILLYSCEIWTSLVKTERQI